MMSTSTFPAIVTLSLWPGLVKMCSWRRVRVAPCCDDNQTKKQEIVRRTLISCDYTGRLTTVDIISTRKHSDLRPLLMALQ